jgi:hypothetical protein
VAEILIDKRIFSLAFPLWVSRLSINNLQVDLRLSSLLSRPKRRENLRRLHLDFQPNHAHLIRAAISQSPRLTHLHLTLTVSSPKVSTDALLAGIEEAPSLSHFSFNFNNADRSTRDLLQDKCWLQTTAEICSFERIINGHTTLKLTRRRDMESRSYSVVNDANYAKLNWSTLRSFEFTPDKNPPVSEFLSGLGNKISEHDSQVSCTCQYSSAPLRCSSCLALFSITRYA